MKRKNATRSALFTSIISLLLCVSMLVGTTFAWFTDTVESGINQIAAGNLDIELEYYDGSKWKTVNEATDLFSNALWEPGHTQVVYLRLSNLGTLALKYNLSINVASEKGGINVAGNPFKLSENIYMGVVENAKPTYTSRDAAISAAKGGANGIIGTGYTKSGTMLKGADALYLAVVVYMPETVGNEANYMTGTNRPEINLGINLFATQLEAESDSFGSDYDKDAVWTGVIDTGWYNTTDTEYTLVTAAELAGLAKIVNDGTDTFANKTVKLGANIDLNNVNWTPIGTSANKFVGTFIGTGYTISDLYSVGEDGVGLFGMTFVGAHIEGVTVENAYVSGNDRVGVIVGGGYLAANCIKNCTVTHATVIATPYFDNEKDAYDGGAKAGVIVGQAYNGNIVGCVVKDSTVAAYRDLGGIAGMLDFDGTTGTVEASGNTVENVTLYYVGVSGKYDDNKPNENMTAVVGRVGTKASVVNNTATNVTLNEANKGATMIFTLEELIAFANDVNSGNTYKGKTVILGADIDLANMEWTPIGNSTNKFQGTFDGNGHTISNLKITSGKSNVGLFGFTTDGEIKNLTVENATVTGYLNVGVVAGTPYTSKYTNITVTGHVEVNGFAYVGGVGGKSAYADWTNITVDVDETSYVKAVSTDADGAWRTYVGGVIGFNGEGGHTFKNITSNIDVIGDVCDIGGVFGIAHYGNNFENITCTGNVTNLVSAENDGDDAATDVFETGLIAGVWHNETGKTVTFKNISATGTISTPNMTPAGKFANGGLIGKAYSASGKGQLIIDGEEVVATLAVLQAKLDAATGTTNIVLAADITGNVTVTQKADVDVVIDGNGHQYTGTITVNGDARSTGAETLTIKNINFVSDTAVDFISAPSKINSRYNYSHNITVDNCTFSAPEYNEDVVGIKVNSSYNLKVTNCTATNIHSLLQAESCGTSVTVDSCTVIGCKSGVSFNNTKNAVIKNSSISAVGTDGYGVRVKAEQANYSLTVVNCKISAFVPVLVRNATATYTVTMDGENSLTSNNAFNYDIVVCTGDWDNDANAPAAPTGNVTLTGVEGFSVF